MKKLTAVILALVLSAGILAACSNSGGTSPAADSAATATKTELVVFAAASMTETLEQIADYYQTEHPDITLTFSFDSSGTLKTQIEEGAVCDLFISAAQKQMNALESEDLIDTATRIDLLENKVVLCVADNTGKDINSYDDMKAHLEAGDILMAIGNEDVPVGQYTQKILAYYDLDEKKLADNGVLTYGSNVKEVTTQINEGAVDCGVVYQTDAYSANLTVADTATEEMCGQVIYPAAVIKASQHSDAAKDFLAYLQTKGASDIFAKVGFTPLTAE